MSEIKMSSLDNSMCHKGEERNYTMEFKCEVNEYAEKNSNHKAAKKFMLLLKGLEKRDRTNFYFYESECDESEKSLFVREQIHAS